MIYTQNRNFDVKDAPPVRRVTIDDIREYIERAQKRPFNLHPGTFSMTVKYAQGIVTFALIDYWDSDMLLKIETITSIADDRAYDIAKRINDWLRAGEEYKYGKSCN